MKKILFAMLSILIIGCIFTGMTTAQEQYVMKYSHVDLADWNGPQCHRKVKVC